MFRVSLLLGLISLQFLGCAEPVTAPPRPPVSVEVSSPVQTDVFRYAEISGRSKESDLFEAKARVQGTLMKASFEEGRLVKEGDVLFLIEQEPYQASLAAAQARLDSAVAQEGLAKANLDRTKALHEKKVVTKAELEQKEAEYNVTKAAISLEEASKTQAEIELGYTTIASEVTGMVGEKLVDEGNIVGVGEFTLLTTVRCLDPLHIYFDAPERVILEHLRKIAEGEREGNKDVNLEIQFEGERGYPHLGELELFDNQIDPSTGTSLLRGTMPNPDVKVLPGAYARIRIRSSEVKDAVLVSEIAIATDLSGKYILIVNDKNDVEMRRVRLGQLYNGFRHIEAMWPPSESEPEQDGDVPTDFEYIHTGLLQARPGLTVEKVEIPLEYEPLETNETLATEETPNAESPSEEPPIPETPEQEAQQSETPADEEPILVDPVKEIPVEKSAATEVPEPPAETNSPDRSPPDEN